MFPTDLLRPPNGTLLQVLNGTLGQGQLGSLAPLAHTMDPALQTTVDVQQASLKSAHALAFWIVGVILLAITVSTGLLVCRSPRGTGRRVTTRGVAQRTTLSTGTDPFCSSVTGPCYLTKEKCAGCKHIEDVKHGAVQRAQSWSTISYDVDDPPPPYRSLEEFQAPLEVRNPYLHSKIQMTGVFGASQRDHSRC